MNQQGITAAELNVAVHGATAKLARIMQRYGNEDGRYDEKFLAVLVVEEIKMNRLAHGIHVISGNSLISSLEME